MTDDTYTAIKQGLEEMLAYAKGDAKGARVSRYPIEQIDVAAIRKMTGLSQAKFCATFGFSEPTLKKWEQGQRRPTGPARALLKVIDRDPNTVLKALAG